MAFLDKIMQNKSSRKLRILCLHGYMQNGKIFREKTGSMRKKCCGLADFDYIDAPNVIKPICNEIDENVGRAWWFSANDSILKTSSYSSQHTTKEATCFNESLEMLTAILDSTQYDGIIGFSQGAAFLAVIAANHQDIIRRNGIRFLIFVSGFRSRQHDIRSVIEIPSLHVFGENDAVIKSERSIRLHELFKNPVVYVHPGGHYVPALKDVLFKFLEKFSVD